MVLTATQALAAGDCKECASCWDRAYVGWSCGGVPHAKREACPRDEARERREAKRVAKTYETMCSAQESVCLGAACA